MNKAFSDRVQELCALIAVEKDRSRFFELVKELNRLLSANEGRVRDGKADEKNES
jgi:hypothetical protein